MDIFLKQKVPNFARKWNLVYPNKVMDLFRKKNIWETLHVYIKEVISELVIKENKNLNCNFKYIYILCNQYSMLHKKT